MGVFLFVLEIVGTGLLLFLVWVGWMAWKAANEGAAEGFQYVADLEQQLSVRHRTTPAFTTDRPMRDITPRHPRTTEPAVLELARKEYRVVKT